MNKRTVLIVCSAVIFSGLAFSFNAFARAEKNGKGL